MKLTETVKIEGIIVLTILSGIVWILFVMPQKPEQESRIIGKKEIIRIVTPKGTKDVLAKIDTGAGYSSIDRNFAISIGLEPNPSQKKIIHSAGDIEMRDTVILTFALDKRISSSLFTVAERTGLSTVMLVGRRDLKGFLVDPTKQLLTSPGEVNMPSLSSLYFKNVWNTSGTEIIIIFPILGAAVVLLRLIVGVRTYGIFAPVAIALSLFELNIFQGMIIYIFLIALGMGVKLLILNRFQIPQIVEMSLIMFVLVLMLMGILAISTKIPLSVTSFFFPLIISSHLIERATKTFERLRRRDALALLFSTIVTAMILAVLFQILIDQTVETIWIVFAVSFMAAFASGKYTGLRLTEFLRFKFLRK